MVNIRKINPVARAIGIIGATAALVAGVTFAAFTSQATLTDNTISTNSAELWIANGGVEPTDNSDTGFTITGLEPGGPPSGPHVFTMKNVGDVDLNVTVFAENSTVTGTIDNNKVDFCFTRVTGGPSTACYTRAEMLANFNTLPGGPIVADNENIEYNMTVSIDADHGGSGFDIAAFDLVFDGTQTP